MGSILDKALLNEKNNQLSRSLQKILNQVYVFTYKKVSYFYTSAIQEYERQRMLENPSSLNFNNQMLDLDKVQISYSAIEQMMGNHAEFLKYLG